MRYYNITQEKEKYYTISSPGRHVFFFRNRTGFLSFTIKKEDAEVYIFGVFDGRGTDRFALTTVQKHVVPRAQSTLLIKSIVRDDARFHYRGLITIEKKAKKTEAHLTNNNLILSNKSFVDTKPQLEILPDDVVCTHAVTTGRLDDEQLYYLRSRGASKKTAEKFLTDGFMRSLFDEMVTLGAQKERRD